ncbi:arginine deiminase family protein [Nocardia panacis]|uniref:arginine deiminase family protein n=1 Tax=Nocardia panacis TaxID=2340916 RepID=UPI00193A4EDB|nr:arginine deiminase family protein [Nocardia panacis]
MREDLGRQGIPNPPTSLVGSRITVCRHSIELVQWAAAGPENMGDSVLEIGVSDEFGALQTVVMRYAGPFTLDLSAPARLDLVHRRQLETSRWQRYDDTIVRAQQADFMAVLRGRGVEVLVADQVPGCYAQHYTRDLGFVVDDVFVVSRLNSAKRQAEFSGMRALVERFSAVAYLDAGTIEGGDVMLHEGCVLVGLSEESSREGVDALRYRLDRWGAVGR